MANPHITNILNNLIGEIFISDIEIQGVFVDYHIPAYHKSILLFEDGHDHPDAYFARANDQNALKKEQNDCLLLWLDQNDPENLTFAQEKISSFLHEAIG